MERLSRAGAHDEAVAAPSRTRAGARAAATPYQAVLDLQRLAGNAAVVQRFTTGNVVGFGAARTSETRRYVLAGATGDDAHSLWVRAGVAAPHYCTATGTTKPMHGGTYAEYAPNSLFLADCLHTAEEVMHGQTLRPQQDASAAGANLFGLSDDANVAAAMHYAAHRPVGGPTAHGEERPAPGQAFAIVETEYTGTGSKRRPANDSGFPYHAAAVVAVDGSDHVTLEQSAGTTDAEQGHGSPGIFDIYTAGSTPTGRPRKAGFHGRHAPSFSKGAITITLVTHNAGSLAADDVPRVTG